MNSTQNFYGSFQPTDRWVPDLVHSLQNNELECMTKIREKVLYDTENCLTFGIGKPRLSMKIDEATQTNETDDDLQLGIHFMYWNTYLFYIPTVLSNICLIILLQTTFIYSKSGTVIQ